MHLCSDASLLAKVGTEMRYDLTWWITLIAIAAIGYNGGSVDVLAYIATLYALLWRYER